MHLHRVWARVRWLAGALQGAAGLRPCKCCRKLAGYLAVEALRWTEPRSRPLRTYLLIAVLLVVIVPVLLLTAVNGYYIASERDAGTRKELTAVAQSIGAQIDVYLDQHLKAVEALASVYAAVGPDQETARRMLVAHHAPYGGFITMLLADRDGTVWAVSPPDAGNGGTVADRAYFQTAMRTGRSYVSGVFQGRGFRYQPIIAISTPLRDAGGRVAGIAEGSLDLAKLERFKYEAMAGVADVLILDPANHVIFSSDPKYKFLESLTGSRLLHMAQTSGPAAVRNGGDGSLVAHAVNQSGWRVVYSRRLVDTQRELTPTLLRTLLWLAAMTLLSIALARIAALHVTAPLQRLVERVRDLGHGRIPLPAAREFASAPVEIVDLASSFDQMSERLTRSYRALEEAKVDLEERVRLRTLELADSNRALQAENADRVKAQADLILRDRAIAAAGEGIVVTDALTPGNPFIYVNSGFEKITGYPAAEALGAGARLLCGPLTEQASLDRFEAAVRAGKPFFGDLVCYRKDGSQFWNRISVTPVSEATGRVRHFIGILVDVTQQKEVERLKAELVSTVSHELRTPLTSLKGFTELMLEHEYPREKQLRFLEIVMRESSRLHKLIDDFLDLQRIESGRACIRPQPGFVQPVIREVCAALGAGSAKHEIAIELEEPLPPVGFDPDRMRQVLTNLVSNAIKFSPDGGVVTVGAGVRNGALTGWVRDEGIGMAPETVRMLFTRFFRADNTETRRTGGTGLGLELAKRIVEAHSGSIWAESTLSVGSTFYWSLPLVTEDGGTGFASVDADAVVPL